MCGILGSVFDAQRVDADRALEELRHRGPDAHGVFRGAGVLLGHTRLSILDLSPLGSQPMKSADGRAVVVFNGEIYNHHQLRAELQSRGRAFRSRSDTEVIVEGYREYGASFFERLDGMFAIGLFDVERRSLVLARDRTGKKPLFYSRHGGGVRFASEIRALFAMGTPTMIRSASLPLLLGLGYVPSPHTLYEHVSQLPPATIIQFDEGGDANARTFWSAPFEATPLNVGVTEATREVRRLVEQAVLRRLEADVPLGAFLSGGIDSSVVVGIVARASTNRVKTFSIGFAHDDRFDETHYARIVAKAFDTDHTEFTLEPSAFELLDRLVEAHDGPFGDSSAIPTSVVSMLTRKHVTVALTGDGGDELFAGYTRLFAAAAAESIPRPIRTAASNLATKLPFQGRTMDRVRRGLEIASLSLPERMLGWQSYFTTDLGAILAPELRKHVDVDLATKWLQEVSARARGASPLARALQLNFDSYLPYDLLVKADRASMLHSLELRSPFLDTQLVEYAARLPDRFRRRGTMTKWILRRAFRDLLPTAILKRGKMGFGMPLATWFRTNLREFVRDTLSSSARLGRYVDLGHVGRMLDEHESGVRDHQHPIWLLLTMERWLNLLPTWTEESPVLRAATEPP